MSQQQQVFSDRYEMVRHVARGGMAQVYLAKDLMLDRPVALKVLFPELSVDRSFVERFRREAQAAANLSHPNIVSVYDWGQGEHTYFIVMEYIDGRTLSSLIREGPIEATRAAAIGADVASALEFAHRHGVIHRDVKPGNVLLDNSGQVKVTDFGIARAVGAKEGLTQTGAVMGTATYFSPEQAQGFAVDARSDVYSLGVVLYEMVVGKPPFEGENPVSIAYQHVREEPILPSVANPLVSKSFEAIVMKAMAKRADDRYESADALRADLMRFQLGQGVLAPEALPTMVAATGVVPRTPVVAPVLIQEPPQGPSRNGLYAGLLVALLILLAVLVFFLGRQLGFWDKGASKLTVPGDVVGKTVTAAKAELSQQGFTNVGATTESDAQVKANLVISTNPTAGTKQTAGKPLTLMVSSGPAPIGVPNVVGQTQQAATQALKAKGFKVAPVQATSPSVAVGSVISTDPAAGQSEAPGSPITLTVSTGEAKVTIPTLAGEDPTTAGSKLQGLGLMPQQKSAASATVTAGEVIGTDPVAGTAVGAKSTVVVLVSTGPANITVPAGLVGETEAVAKAQLAAAGLGAQAVSETVTDKSQDGLVQSATPPPGSSAAPGVTVTLTIGQYTQPTSVVPTSLIGLSAADAEAQLSALSLTFTTTPQTVTNSAQNGMVLSTNPAGGTTVPQGTKITLTVGSYTAPPTSSSTTTIPTTDSSTTTTASGT
jgi:beta-lactam-binding protein with PASTA domain